MHAQRPNRSIQTPQSSIGFASLRKLGQRKSDTNHSRSATQHSAITIDTTRDIRDRPAFLGDRDSITTEPNSMTPEESPQLDHLRPLRFPPRPAPLELSTRRATDGGITTVNYAGPGSPRSPRSPADEIDPINFIWRPRPALSDVSEQTSTKKQRNLVVCIDGTSNQFGTMVRPNITHVHQMLM